MTDLSLSDWIILMFALKHLSTSGDGMLTARGWKGRKLAGGLDYPFREHLLSLIECITEKGFDLLSLKSFQS